MLKRGEVWLADLNPSHGTEPGKTRPVLVIQSQALLDAGHPSTLVIPLTTKLVDDAGRLPKLSDLLMDQMRAIDNGRLVKGPLLRLSNVQMRQIGSAFLEIIGIEM